MPIRRRTFLAGIGGAAASLTAVTQNSGAATPAQNPLATTAVSFFDSRALVDRASADGEFQRAARYWNARLRLGIGDRTYDAVVRDGTLTTITPDTATTSQPDVTISGPADAWQHGFAAEGLKIEGDQVTHVAPYRGAILRIVALVREGAGQPPPAMSVQEVDRQFDTAVGRYVYVRIQGVQYRVYYEEAGQGIPLVLQHSAAADNRNWRFLLEDPEIQKRFRIIAWDLPYHGKSGPPTTVPWWAQEYRLTRDRLMDSVLAICQALKADRPVFMGVAAGGFLATDLALYHPDKFRAVIGVNASIAGPDALARANGRPVPTNPGPNVQDHPRVSNGANGISIYQVTSPVAPEPYRREVAWLYSISGPGIMPGDLHYYSVEHDLTGGRASKIDTSRVDVYLVSGEYDATAGSGPGGAEALARQIKGASYAVVKGGSHLAPHDDYPRFRQTLLPILDKIHAKHA